MAAPSPAGDPLDLRVPHHLRAGWVALASGVAVYAIALVVRGRTHPDEVFQYLEPAFREVYGYGQQAWEWREGIRNWFVPGLIVLLLRALRAMHLEGARSALAVVWALGAAGHALGMVALFRIIERRSGRIAAAVGVLLLTTWLSYALYAPRTLADALSIPPLLWALLHTLRARDAGRFGSGLAAGLCVGLAVVMRYPSLVFGVPLGVSLLLARRWRALLGLAVGSGLVLVALGLLDLATWGTFLHALRSYVAFNRPGGPVAERFGAEPWWWYLLPLGGMVPLVTVPAFLRGLRKPDLLAGSWLFYLGVLEVSAHKEGRFLLPLLPIGMAIAAGPFAEQLARWVWPHRARRVAFALAWLAMSVASPLWQWTLSVHRDLLDAEVLTARDPELENVLVVGAGNFGDGGHFHLRRDVPLDVGLAATPNHARIRERQYSHVISEGREYLPDLEQAGYRRWLERGEVSVWKRPLR